MKSYSVRCRNAKCRHRRVTHIHPDNYKVVPKCEACGRRDGWRVENRDYNKRGLCHCGGPEMHRGVHFPHRTTHPLCDNHPHGLYNRAKHMGVSDDDIPLEAMGRKMKETDDCPF
jgi:hypothetical protein